MIYCTTSRNITRLQQFSPITLIMTNNIVTNYYCTNYLDLLRKTLRKLYHPIIEASSFRHFLAFAVEIRVRIDNFGKIKLLMFEAKKTFFRTIRRIWTSKRFQQNAMLRRKKIRTFCELKTRSYVVIPSRIAGGSRIYKRTSASSPPPVEFIYFLELTDFHKARTIFTRGHREAARMRRARSANICEKCNASRAMPRSNAKCILRIVAQCLIAP